MPTQTKSSRTGSRTRKPARKASRKRTLVVAKPVPMEAKGVRQGLVPKFWDRAVMVYPPGGHRIKERSLDYISKEQWGYVEDLLYNGYTIGFIAFDGEVASTTCEAVQALTIPVVATEDAEDSMVYISSARGNGAKE